MPCCTHATSFYLNYYDIYRVAFFPLQIGDHVFIGDNSIVNAAVVNSYVYIGKNVTIVSTDCILFRFIPN